MAKNRYRFTNHRCSNFFMQFLITSFLLSFNQVHSETSLLNFIGYAYDIKNNKLLYTEHHNYLNKFEHQVFYRNEQGKIIATKYLDYRHNFYSPDFIQENLTIGERISSRKNKDDIEVSYKESTISPTQKKSINFSPRLIIDAGFDHFINQNWNSLLQGQELEVDYLIPARLGHYQLSIKQESCEKQVSKNRDNLRQTSLSTYCFSISSSNFLIRLITDELKLTYQKYADDIRLINFKGRSNICDEDGNYLDVNIIYHYDISLESI